MEFKFYGAARTVTGSKHLLQRQDGLRILLDCGMFQGAESNHGKENSHFDFDPESIDLVILSHAHIDHSGMLPLLVKEGFQGPIYCTEATADLCEIMLADSAHIQEADAEYANRKHHNGDEVEKPLYTRADVDECLTFFKPLEFKKWHQLTEGVELMFTFIGHILGSGCVNLKIKEGKKTHKICYTGDVGRHHHQIIRSPEPFPQAEIIITESTYGDKIHPNPENAKQELGEIVRRTCVEQKGKLIIPAFSLGRTQEIVYALDQLYDEGKLPPVKVYVDSPLSTNATEIVRNHPECFNDRILNYMKHDSNPFGFKTLHYIRDVSQSKELNTSKEPCIIISASGMIEAGRILHHVRNNVEDPRNTILIVGYCEPSSLGGQLRDGAKKIKIFGQEKQVNASVEIMDSYSAHGDYKEMIQYLSCQNPQLIRKLFLVHGRYEVQEVYKKHLEDAGFYHIEIPKEEQSFTIDPI